MNNLPYLLECDSTNRQLASVFLVYYLCNVQHTNFKKYDNTSVLTIQCHSGQKHAEATLVSTCVPCSTPISRVTESNKLNRSAPNLETTEVCIDLKKTITLDCLPKVSDGFGPTVGTPITHQCVGSPTPLLHYSTPSWTSPNLPCRSSRPLVYVTIAL